MKTYKHPCLESLRHTKMLNAVRIHIWCFHHSFAFTGNLGVLSERLFSTAGHQRNVVVTREIRTAEVIATALRQIHQSACRTRRRCFRSYRSLVARPQCMSICSGETPPQRAHRSRGLETNPPAFSQINIHSRHDHSPPTDKGLYNADQKYRPVIVCIHEFVPSNHCDSRSIEMNVRN